MIPAMWRAPLRKNSTIDIPVMIVAEEKRSYRVKVQLDAQRVLLRVAGKCQEVDLEQELVVPKAEVTIGRTAAHQ